MDDETSLVAREQRELITRRLAPFAIGWLAAMGIWLVAFGVEGRLTLTAAALAGAAAATLALALRVARADPTAARVVPVTVATCVTLGIAATAMVYAVDAYGEILAFMLLTLYLAAALLFSWGWRAELTLLLTTLLPWMLVLHRFRLFVPRLELAAAVAIGASLALAVAESSARSARHVSRRRRAQEEATDALQGSRDAYRDLAETARDMIWSADADGRLTYVNGAMERFVGRSADHLLGCSLAEFYSDHPDNPSFAAVRERLLRGEVLPPIQLECATARGPRWIEVMSAAVVDGHGTVTGLRGINRDIQERRDAEEALRASEERFRSAFDYAPIGMVVIGMDRKAIQVNRAFCEMLGYEAAALMTRTMDSLALPEDVAYATAEIGRLLRDEIRTCQMEKRYLHKDGHVVWCLLSCSLTRDAVGRPLHVIAQIQDISERKAAEDALRASESRYRGLVESQHELIVRLDPAGRFTFVNDAYAAKFGRTQHELLGRSFFELVHRDDQPVITAAVAAMGRPPHRVLIEVRNHTAEGDRWIAWEGGVVLDPAGRLVEAQAVGRDVTERRAAEDALRASEARYRGLVESAHEAVARSNLDGRLTFANDAYCQAVDTRREEIVGRDPIFLVHPDDHAVTLAALRAALRPPHRCRVESRALTPQGWRWFEWEVSGVRDADERVVEIQHVGRDVTARRQAETDLRESEERFRSAFEDAGIGMGVTTIEGRLLRVNRAICDMFGYAEHELLGRTLFDLVHPEDREMLRQDHGQLLQTAQTYRADRRYVRADGEAVWVVATASVVRGANGQPLYLIGQMQDVTERRLAEEALRGSLASLRHSEEKLRLLAQRQVAIREEERKRLSFDLHDDVCQELVGVGILVESLRRKLAPMPAEFAGEFDRIVGYLGEVVEHLRLLARELRPLLLRDLGLDGSLRSLADGMSSAALRVVTALEGTIPRLDEEAEVTVYRIAQEALANAARHAGASRIVIGLAAASGTLRLEVRDDGRGFDPAVRPAVALGLASMEERALALGGRLHIDSAPGAGTSVTLACPIVVRPGSRLMVPAGPSPRRSSSRPSAATTPRSAARD